MKNYTCYNFRELMFNKFFFFQKLFPQHASTPKAFHSTFGALSIREPIISLVSPEQKKLIIFHAKVMRWKMSLVAGAECAIFATEADPVTDGGRITPLRQTRGCSSLSVCTLTWKANKAGARRHAVTARPYSNHATLHYSNEARSAMFWNKNKFTLHVTFARIPLEKMIVWIF